MQPILGPGGKIRGYLKEVGHRQELLAPGGRLLGYYDWKKNQTTKAGGIFFGYGNQLISLLED